MAMFERAKHVKIYGGSFAANAGVPTKGLDKLVGAVAPNAILNAGGRADEVRCFPGTREEVIGKLEKFMDDKSPGRKRMMWLSGPAGAGKSAICQTVAERREEQGQQAANFFFFRGDSTRSHSKPLVATLVYQLRDFYPALDELLSKCLEKNPLICSASIEAQFKQLISSPFQTIRQSTPTHIQPQIVIVIDGLDECSNDTRDQDQILTALHTLAHADNSPFLILVSSRAEPQLVMSFNRLGSLVESIFLNDDYKPKKDIRRFVVAKFAEIKRDHHLTRTLGEKWPTTADIDAIVKKSSGQFIYAVTVMRFIQFSSSSPALSLVTILEMSLYIDHNPLAHLDAVYSHIFSKAHNIQAVKLILFARYCTISRGHPQGFVDVLQLVGYDDIKVQSILADLVAVIMVLPGTRPPFKFYHASLDDYLNDKSRSTIYCVNENELAAEFSSMCLRNIHDADSIRVAIFPLSYVQQPTPELSKSLLAASTKYVGHHINIYHLNHLMARIEKVYWEHDKDQFKVLLQSWTRFVYINNLEKVYHTRLEATNPSASQYYEQYWMTKSKIYSGHKPQRPSDSAHNGIARSDIQVIPATDSPNTAIDNPVCDLSVRNPGPSRGNDPYNNVRTRTGTAGWRGAVAGPACEHPSRSVFSELVDSLRSKFRRRRPRGTGRPVNIHEQEAQEYESREYDGTPQKIGMIRVKFHYQDDIRSMTLTPDTLFSEFAIKVTTKFGKDFDDLTIKFKDKQGDKITIRDDSDYEHAIEIARQSSEGQAEGLLEIWCQDRL